MLEVSVGLDAVGFGRFDQAVKTRAGVGTFGRVGEEPVLAANHKRPDGVFSVDLLALTTHHTSLDAHLMEIKNQKLNILKSITQRPSVDTQGVCDLEFNPNDTKQYQISA